jgi:hypothetical protein
MRCCNIKYPIFLGALPSSWPLLRNKLALFLEKLESHEKLEYHEEPRKKKGELKTKRGL